MPNRNVIDRVPDAPARPGEAELVARLLQGDEAAFEDLVDQHHDTMLRIARLFVKTANVARREGRTLPFSAVGDDLVGPPGEPPFDAQGLWSHGPDVGPHRGPGPPRRTVPIQAKLDALRSAARGAP